MDGLDLQCAPRSGCRSKTRRTERASHVRLQAVIVVLRVDFSCHYYEGHKGQDASSERESRGHSHRFVGGKTRAPVTSSQNLICMVMLS